MRIMLGESAQAHTRIGSCWVIFHWDQSQPHLLSRQSVICRQTCGLVWCIRKMTPKICTISRTCTVYASHARMGSICSSTNHHSGCVRGTRQGFKPPGARVHEYKRRAKTFSVYRATGEDPGACEYHGRAQCLAPWLIEGGLPKRFLCLGVECVASVRAGALSTSTAGYYCCKWGVILGTIVELLCNIGHADERYEISKT